jgi:hypothetical protein
MYASGTLAFGFAPVRHRERFAAMNALGGDHPAYCPGAMSYKLRATSYELRATSYELRATSYGPPLPPPQKEKAPEGAFNMLRLVRQAD